MANLGLNHNPAVEQHKEISSRLAGIGLDPASLDNLIQKAGGVEEVLKNNKMLARYFGTALQGLYEITSWKFEDRVRSLSGETPTPEAYKPYFEELNGIEFQDYIPEEVFFKPDSLAEKGYLSSEQAEALGKILEEGIFVRNNQSSSQATDAAEQGSGTGVWNQSNIPGNAMAKSNEPSQSQGSPAPGALPPPPGANGGLPPPPSFDDPNVSYTQEGRDFVAGFDNPAVNSWLEIMFNREDDYRLVMMGLASSVDDKKRAISELMALMGGLDPSNPEDMRKMKTLEAQLFTLRGDLQEEMDMMMTASKARDSFKEMVKSIMESINKTLTGIVQNMRVN